MSYIAKYPNAWARGQSSLFEDFLNGATGSQIASSVAGAGAAVSAVSGIANHPGIAELDAGTTNAGTAGVLTGPASLLFGGGVLDLSWLVMIPTLSTGVETFTFRAGFLDVATGAAVDGAYYECESNGNANWVTTTANNSSRTLTTSSVPVVAGQWYSLRVLVNADASRVNFLVDGVDTGSPHTVNIPSTAGRLTGIGASIVKSAGTTSRVARADYCSFSQIFTAARG